MGATAIYTRRVCDPGLTQSERPESRIHYRQVDGCLTTTIRSRVGQRSISAAVVDPLVTSFLVAGPESSRKTIAGWPQRSPSSPHPSLHPLNPLGPPQRRLEGVCEILRLVYDLAVAHLHDAHRIR